VFVILIGGRILNGTATFDKCACGSLLFFCKLQNSSVNGAIHKSAAGGRLKRAAAAGFASFRVFRGAGPAAALTGARGRTAAAQWQWRVFGRLGTRQAFGQLRSPSRPPRNCLKRGTILK
jgi:hypothetical protein